MWQFFLALGFLFSPENLSRLGDGMAGQGEWFLVALAGVVVMQACTGISMGRNAAAEATHPSLDNTLTYSALFSARLFMFPFLAVLLSSAAGYIAQATMLPDVKIMALSFFMLVITAAVRILAPSRDRFMLQFLTAATVIALIVLVGLMAYDGSKAAAEATKAAGGLDWNLLLLPLLLTVGFELGGEDRPSPKPSLWVLAVMLGVFYIVGQGMLASVGLDKLASSEAPYLAMTSQALGDNGLILMGVAGLCGSFAAMNALLIGMRKTNPFAGERRKGMIIDAAIPLVAAAGLLALKFGDKDATQGMLWGGVASMYLAYAFINLFALQLPASFSGKFPRLAALAGVLGSCLAVAAILVYSPDQVYTAGVFIAALAAMPAMYLAKRSTVSLV